MRLLGAWDNDHIIWLTEEFLFWAINVSFKWVRSCHSYVHFISLVCPVNSLKCLSPKEKDN